MKTRITKKGATTVIAMDGRIDFETQEPLRRDLTKLVDRKKTDSVPHQIIVNLEKLEFVGSSGISAFVQTLREFNALAPQRPKYVGVRNEFKRVIKAFDPDDQFQFFDHQEDADDGKLSQ